MNRRIVIELVALVAIVAVALDFNNLSDQIALYTFDPGADIAPIIAQLELTPHAKAILYRARPEIDDKATFTKNCSPTVGELELGCFVHNRIYILRIDNTSLAPEMTVVLGHELLHAVWAQTGQSERNTLGTELEAVYHGLNDQDLKTRMAGYATSEPGQETNELHSILGTEFPNLTPELESHYATVFGDRTVLTKAQAAYTQVFNSRKTQLNLQARQIESLKSELTSIENQMRIDRTSGQIAAYNALVPRQNSLVEQVNNEVASYNQGVEEYNALSNILDATQLTPQTN